VPTKKMLKYQGNQALIFLFIENDRSL